MNSIAECEGVDKLPVHELEESLRRFLEPVTRRLGDKRLREVCVLMVQGILAAQSPRVTEMARGLERDHESSWPLARRAYRFLWNKRFSHRLLLKGLCALARDLVARYPTERLVIAIDPVNFEKPYTQELEGISEVIKSTPPGPGGEKRITPGYPAITAAVVNLPEPVVAYAQWFSYQTEEFVSENREIYRALRICHLLFPGRRICFVTDAGFDDQKIFRWMGILHSEFIIRVSHDERLVEVYNDRLDRWEREHLQSFAETVLFACRWQVLFTHAHQTRRASIDVGWFRLRLPTDPDTPYWILVAHDVELNRDLLLITNVPLETEEAARRVYEDWRRRTQIEHLYRFDQERGLDVEDISVHTVERIRRLFLLVLLAAMFVYEVAETWPRMAVLWLRHLGGKLDLPLDADGPYILLAGISAVFIAATTLAFAKYHLFPRGRPTCG
jgi:hypothetical protein